MRTITIDIINEKAIHLLQDLELLKLIRLRKEKTGQKSTDWGKCKGTMSNHPIREFDQQLNELGSE